MKNSINPRAPVLGLAIITGTLLTVGLLLAISFLANDRSPLIEKRPLLVVNLMAWSAPDKQNKGPSPPTPLPKREPEPELKPPSVLPPKAPPKAADTQAAPPQPAPKSIREEKPIEPPVSTPTATPATAPAEREPSNSGANTNNTVVPHNQPTLTTKTTETLPTPVPFFQLTNPPRFLHRETPIYPQAMHADGISGVVKLEALIDKEGNVRQITILESAGKYFDEAAKNALMLSRFYPAEVDNTAVAVLLRLPVKFELR